jgi:glycine/sarcosine N-methyltransferase
LFDSKVPSHISKELFIAAVVIVGEIIVYHYFVIIEFNLEEPLRSIMEFIVKYSIAAVMAVFTLLFVLAISVLKNRNLFDKIFEIQTKKREAKRAVQALFSIRVEDFLSILKKLEDQNEDAEGAEVDYALASKFAEFCFQEGTAYSGTDIHIPSSYLEVQESYLVAHKILQDNNKIKADEDYKNENSARGTRFLICSQQDIDNDAEWSNKDYNEFVDWHVKNKVKLKRVDLDDAKRYKENHRLKSIEIAVWYNKYSLQWRRSDKNPDKVILSLAYKGTKQYQKCLDYIEYINRGSIKITNKSVKKPPKKLNKELAKSWSEFVDTGKRSEIADKFLRPIIEEYSKEKHKTVYETLILDVAAGLGCETDFFESLGYNVTANEIDANVYESMQNHGSKVNRTSYDWRVMAKKFSLQNKKFDIVLFLGNSFCLLDEDPDRQRVLQQIYHVLEPNGLLIVDQRNFDKILNKNNRSEVVSLNKFYSKFYKRKCLYCGEAIKGWPVNVDEDIVTFAYGRDEQNRMQEIRLYPFKGEELKRRLERSKFVDIKVYSDMDEENEGISDDADFFTFVAKK